MMRSLGKSIYNYFKNHLYVFILILLLIIFIIFYTLWGSRNIDKVEFPGGSITFSDKKIIDKSIVTVKLYDAKLIFNKKFLLKITDTRGRVTTTLKYIGNDSDNYDENSIWCYLKVGENIYLKIDETYYIATLLSFESGFENTSATFNIYRSKSKPETSIKKK